MRIGLQPTGVEESAEELYEEAPCGYLSVAWDSGTILRANRTFSRWTGFDAGHMLCGRRFDGLLSKPGRILYETRYLPQLTLGANPTAVLLEMLRADGSRLPILANSTVRRYEDGRPALVRMTLFDATERRRYERGLLEARRRAEQAEAEMRVALQIAQAADLAKTRFIAAMNHEFRTPVGLVIGFSELLSGAAKMGQPHPLQAQYLADIGAAAKHLLRLVEDSVLYAETTGAQLPLRRGPVSAAAILSRAAQLAAAAAEECGVHLVLPALAAEPVAVVDFDALTKGVAGMLREMARCAPTGATIKAAFRMEPEEVAFELRCATLELSEVALAALLAPLEASEVYHRGLQGSGLGAALAQQVVALHGGRIRGRSEPGNGIGITITLPRDSKVG